MEFLTSHSPASFKVIFFKSWNLDFFKKGSKRINSLKKKNKLSHLRICVWWISQYQRPLPFSGLSFGQNQLIASLEIPHHQSIHLMVYLSKKSTAACLLSEEHQALTRSILYIGIVISELPGRSHMPHMCNFPFVPHLLVGSLGWIFQGTTVLSVEKYRTSGLSFYHGHGHHGPFRGLFMQVFTSLCVKQANNKDRQAVDPYHRLLSYFPP